MPAWRRGDALFVCAAGLLAATIALGMREVVDHRLESRALPALSAALGVPVRIRAAEAGLTGTLRLDGVEVGDVFSAAAIEAGVGPTALLRGRLGADEIRVKKPSLRVRVARDGSLDVQGLVQAARTARRARLDARGGSASDGMRAPRRILVDGGELVLTLEDHGEIRARGVALHPHEHGVRVVTGEVTLDLHGGGSTLLASFARAGLEIDLDHHGAERAALAGGTVTWRHGDGAPLSLHEVAVAHTRGATRIEARAAGGAPLSIDITRADGVLQVTAEAHHLPGAAFAALAPGALDPRDATLGGTLRATQREGAIEVVTDLEIAGLRVTHDLVSREPVPFSGRVRLSGSWDERAGEARGEVHAETGALHAVAELELRTGAAGLRAGRLRLEVPELPCGEALAAVPAPLRRPLDGMVLDGRISGSAELAFDRDTEGATIFEIALDNRCLVLVEPAGSDAGALVATDYRHILPDGTPRVLGASSPAFVSIGDLPGHVIDAFVAGEDARFFHHHGFDVEQMARSFEIDVRVGRVERGGSTMSQQLAKNLFLTRERTLFRKALEAVLTWRLEARVGKRRMLEAYLNVIELGEGIYGLEPAAQHWFGKPARELDLEEAAFLAALTPAPVSSHRRLRAAGGLDPVTRGRVEAILRSMRRNRLIDDHELRRAMRHLARLPLLVGSG